MRFLGRAKLLGEKCKSAEEEAAAAESEIQKRNHKVFVYRERSTYWQGSGSEGQDLKRESRKKSANTSVFRSPNSSGGQRRKSMEWRNYSRRYPNCTLFLLIAGVLFLFGFAIVALQRHPNPGTHLPDRAETTDDTGLLTFTQFFAEPNKLSLKDCPVLLLFTNVTFPAII
ncbi:unnamed protein product [Sphagnum balticum]